MNDQPQRPIQDYAIQRWGNGYFEINAKGNLSVRPDPNGSVTIDLRQLANEVRSVGLSWPVLVRFGDILHHRVQILCRGFAQAFAEFDYRARFTAIYPIKVNQQRSVIEQILASGDKCVGLEAGSKPELMAVLALSAPGGMVICNGYKDREYIRLALIGGRLGFKVYIVIEKSSELDLVLKEALDLDITPRLGLRVRLVSSAQGNWQNSGGEKAKFGLAAPQVLALVERLQQIDKLDRLQLLHAHIGSQIPNLRDIRRSMNELAHYFAELVQLGVPLRKVDVGGGLGIDYEGTGTHHFCSTNYSLENYAREVVKALAKVCAERSLSPPDIITESGRAITAHHAVLITNVVDRDQLPAMDEPPPLDSGASSVLRQLYQQLDRIGSNSPLEVYQEVRHCLEESRELFERGLLSLPERARAEQLYLSLCHRIRPLLRPSSRRHREALDQLNEQLAEKIYCNFSLFQSMPDVWAIKQIFPVVPLQRLNEPPEGNAILHDLTCDSDGCIQCYVDQDGVESTLPIHRSRPGEPYLFGIFLLGAYQEILGDMHNLFGDTDTVNLELDGQGGYGLTQAERGDSVDELLRYVHFDTVAMLAAYRASLARENISPILAEGYFNELSAGLHGYTYLED